MKFAQKAAAAASMASLSAMSFAAGPTAGDLSNLTPDISTVVLAIGAVALVMLGKDLAILGFNTVKRLFK